MTTDEFFLILYYIAPRNSLYYALKKLSEYIKSESFLCVFALFGKRACEMRGRTHVYISAGERNVDVFTVTVSFCRNNELVRAV